MIVPKAKYQIEYAEQVKNWNNDALMDEFTELLLYISDSELDYQISPQDTWKCAFLEQIIRDKLREK